MKVVRTLAILLLSSTVDAFAPQEVRRWSSYAQRSSNTAFKPTEKASRARIAGAPGYSPISTNRYRSLPSSLLRVSSEVNELAGDGLGEENALRTKRIDTIALWNAVIVGTLTFAALYELFHVDVQALVALWEYDMGPTTSASLTKVAVAVDLLARLPMDALHSYEDLVKSNPIFYKACTSGVAYGIGDFISQVYQGRTMSTIDLPRSFRSAAAGFIGHGPLCHQWLLAMENYLDFDGAWWATGIKVTADLTVWSIFLNAAYSFLIGTLAFRNPRDVWKDMQATSWPALRSAWRFWPFVHTISFSHAVPIDLKLLWVDVMEVVWVTILSKVANEDKNARMEKEEVVVGEQVCVLQDHGVEPALEIELTREDETAKSDELSFELPKKVLAACWPLIVMWPVLYAGYQIETKVLGLDV